MKLLDFFFISIYLLSFTNNSFGGNTETKQDDRATTSNSSGTVVSQNTEDNSGSSTQPERTQEDTGLGNSLAVEQNQTANSSRNAPSMPNTQTESFYMMPGRTLPIIWESSSGTGKQKEKLPVDQTVSSEKRSKQKGSTSTDGSTDEKKDSRKKKTSKSKKTEHERNSPTDDSQAATNSSKINHNEDRSEIPESSSNDPQSSSLQRAPPISVPRTQRQFPSTLDQARAEGLLLSFKAQRRMWAVPLQHANGISCSVRPWQRAITHYLLMMKNISIPVAMGTFQVRTVSFTYYPDAEKGRFVLLECDCEITSGGFGYVQPIPDFYFAMFTPAEAVCVDGKIHLLKGVMGPNSFFIFSYNPLSNHYKVLAHIVVT